MEAGLRHPQPAQPVAALHDLSTGAFLPGPITKPQALLTRITPAIKGVSFRNSLFSLALVGRGVSSDGAELAALLARTSQKH
jgi:hypothetical protein